MKTILFGKLELIDNFRQQINILNAD